MWAFAIRFRLSSVRRPSFAFHILIFSSEFRPNFAGMVLGWPPFKIVSDSHVFHPRWPPLLKIEISSNGQNCSILSQNVPKFELYKHNDELWTFTDFGRLCRLVRNHLANCNKTLVEWSLDGPFQNYVRWSRLPTKMATKLKIEKRGDEIKKKSSPGPISTKLCLNDP